MKPWAWLMVVGLPLSAGEIALSFDDAPRRDSVYFSGMERTQRLILGLKEAGVAQAVFFVTTGNIDGPQSRQRLEMYTEAGHLLGNHSHSHQHPDRMGAQAYVADIAHAHRQLKEMKGFRPWYRYPFLDEGRERETRNAVLAGLAELGYRNGYVTVDNYDFYMDTLLQRAVTDGKKVNLEKLKTAYLEILWQGIQFYDNIGRQVLDRSPKHVLLLHENDLAALFIVDLVAMLREKGWRIITADEAYGDPIAQVMPQTIWQNQGRVAAIARDKGFQGRDLVHESEDEEFLESYFMNAGVFE